MIISPILPQAVDYTATQLKIRKINDNLRYYPIPDTIFLLAYGPERWNSSQGVVCTGWVHLLPVGVALVRQVWITKVKKKY